VYYGKDYTEDYYQVHEVYYNSSGAITSITENAVAAYGDSENELGSVFNMMKQAFEKPTLDFDNIEFAKTE
jgi:hypothetical protein